MQNVQAGQLPPLKDKWDSNLGDIILGTPVIQQTCIADKVLLKNRLPVIITHGLCHLAGYHHLDEQNMKLVGACMNCAMLTPLQRSPGPPPDVQQREIHVDAI